jgi:maleylacetoacetate isomerase
MQLHSFFNSSTSFRVRIALALKRLPYDCIPVNLREHANRDADYLALNPSGGVPVLIDEGFALSQSLAIIDYLDAITAVPRLLPENPRTRSRVLELSHMVACDIHPINNMRVLRYLKHELSVDVAQTQAWYHHWVSEGLGAIEMMLKRFGAAPFCFGDAPTLADCCLVPQVANSLRMGCTVNGFERTMAVYHHCMTLPAFQHAAPAKQPDYADGAPAGPSKTVPNAARGE